MKKKKNVKKTSKKNKQKKSAKSTTNVKIDKNFINLCKKILLEKYNELRNINYQKEINTMLDVGDEADLAGNDLGKEIFHELSDTQKNLLELVVSALEKVDKGVYGICESCGNIIEKKRLKALPWVRYCLKCQNNFDKYKK
ncbi:MAG: TraR/DksA family transcriptional regulator [Endomicrobiia bacterium]